jgi:hypothetical protein
MEHTKHLWRAIILIFIVVFLYFVGRVIVVQLLYPTFGEYGPYRGDSLREEMAHQVKHGTGIDSCRPCHEDKVSDFLDTAHAGINCEVCHAPLITHVHFDDIEDFITSPENYEWTEEMKNRQARDLCIRCHESQPAKPAAFPQIVVVDHLNEMAAEDSANVCLECHDPHDPSM